MDGNNFEHIVQELVKQKHLMDQLEAENRDLRQQLANLRAGRGIFVDIAGSRFALRDSPSPHDHLARSR
jgi:cell division protein FtsB